MGRKKSIVWNHFKISESDSTKAVCNYCAFPVGRGQKSQGTTSLMNHLKRCKQLKARLSYVFPHAEISGVSKEFPDRAADDFYEASSKNEEGNASSLVLPSSPLTDQPFVQEYQNNGKPSVLLYGDISSTHSCEEPSSSVNPDSGMERETSEISTNSAEISTNSTDLSISSSFMHLAAYKSSETTVDFMHGGIVLHMLYDQYKSGQFCDLKLVTQNPRTSRGVISSTGKITRSSPGEVKNELKVHSCLLATMSKKINVMVGMGCSSIELNKGSYEALQRLMEVVYTGKINEISVLSLSEVQEILEISKYLEVEIAEKYLQKQRPDLEKPHPKGRQIVPESLPNPQAIVEVLSTQAYRAPMRKYQKSGTRAKSLGSLLRGGVSKFNLNRNRRTYARRHPRPFSNFPFLPERTTPSMEQARRTEQLRESRREKNEESDDASTSVSQLPVLRQVRRDIDKEEEAEAWEQMDQEDAETDVFLSSIKAEILEDDPDSAGGLT